MRHSPPATITVTLGPASQLSLTPYGQPLTALEDGTYTVTANDASPPESFYLSGPSTNRSTGIRAVETENTSNSSRPSSTNSARYHSGSPASHTASDSWHSGVSATRLSTSPDPGLGPAPRGEKRGLGSFALSIREGGRGCPQSSISSEQKGPSRFRRTTTQ